MPNLLIHKLCALADERRALSDTSGLMPSELWVCDLFYLTEEERVELHQAKQNLPTFGELQKQAKVRLKNRKRGRK